MAQRRDIFLRRVISMLMLICTLFTVAAQTQRADTLVATVCFRQSLADLDPDYMNNREALDAFLAAYRAIPVTEDPAIHIIGYASPEGSLAFNRSISQRRADALAEYLSNQLNVPASKITTEGAGVDWAGLVQAVENDPNVPKRDKVLEIVSTEFS